MNNIPYFQIYAVDFLTLTQKLSEREVFLILTAVSEICLYGKTDIKIENFYAKIFYEKLLKDLEKNKKKYVSSMENGKKGGRPPKPKKPIEKTDWEEMLEFFDYTCLDCGCKMSKEDRPTKDHIIPQILGGDNFITNLQPLCRQCNAKKCADHSTDFRLKFISDIPKSLKIKWFKHNPQVIDGFDLGYEKTEPNQNPGAKQQKQKQKHNKKQKIIKEKINKKEFGEFKNVLLSDAEYQKLFNLYFEKLDEAIEYLSSKIKSNGYKYDSHYAVMGKTNWVYKNIMEQGGGQKSTPLTKTEKNRETLRKEYQKIKEKENEQ